jgi:hypothetical protein
VEWTDVIYVKWFCFEVKWVTVKFLGTKVPCTLGWPYTEGTWLYCDYFIWCVIIIRGCGGAGLMRWVPVRWVWTFARASFNRMRRCGWTRWSVSLFPDDGDYLVWATYDLPSGARKFLSLVLGVVDVGWCRSFLANVVSTSLQIKNGSPCRTWLDPFSGDVGLLMTFFYSSDFRSSGKKEKFRRPGGTRPHFEIHINIGCKPYNCIPLMVMHFKIYVIMMSVQLDLIFLQIVNYVICHPN